MSLLTRKCFIFHSEWPREQVPASSALSEKTICPINYLMKEFYYCTSRTEVLHNNLFCCAIRSYFSIFFVSVLPRPARSARCGESMQCIHSIQYFNSFSHSLFISNTTMVYFHTFCQIDFRFVHSRLLFRSCAGLPPPAFCFEFSHSAVF